MKWNVNQTRKRNGVSGKDNGISAQDKEEMLSLFEDTTHSIWMVSDIFYCCWLQGVCQEIQYRESSEIWQRMKREEKSNVDIRNKGRANFCMRYPFSWYADCDMFRLYCSRRYFQYLFSSLFIRCHILDGFLRLIPLAYHLKPTAIEYIWYTSNTVCCVFIQT